MKKLAIQIAFAYGASPRYSGNNKTLYLGGHNRVEALTAKINYFDGNVPFEIEID